MKPTPKILAIDPGSKEIGVALLEGSALRYHDVLSINVERRPTAILAEIRSRIDRLIGDFRPTALAIEKTFVGKNQSTAILNVIVSDLISLGRERKLPILLASALTVRKAITGFGWTEKEDLAKVIVSRYFRELRPYLGMKRESQALFHLNRFDAIALGLWAAEQLSSDREWKR